MRTLLCVNVALLLVLTLVISVYGLESETLPTYHWTYDVLEELQLQGILSTLNLSERPLTRGQIAAAVIQEIEEQHPQRVYRLLKLLQREFAAEIISSKKSLSDLFEEAVGQVISPVGGEAPPLKGDIGLRFQGDLAVIQDQDTQTDGIAIAQVGVEFKSNIAAHARLRMDSHLPDDPTYDGKVWNEIAGYAEAGYFRYDGRIFDLQFGRDRHEIGSGKSVHMLLSDYSLPLDGLWISASLKNFRYSFLTVQLDTMMYDRFPGETLERYLALHRIWFRPHRRLSIGISEAVLYAGPNRTFELQFLNPFLYWHGEVLNRKGAGNIFVMLDWDWFPLQGLEFYGELMIDDLQIEKKIPEDLEPNEIGWLVGTRFTNLPVVPNAVTTLEYLGVTNRTYNSKSPHEKYLHLGQPLGCELGNDLDRLMMTVSQWVRPNLQCALTASYLRKGKGSITAQFDTTYLQFTVEAGYDEPFPTGTVQKETTLGIELFFIPTYAVWIRMESGMTWISNAGHVAGEIDEQGWFNLSLVLELDDLIDNRH